MVAHFNIAVGLTFSGGLFDFIVFGVLQVIVRLAGIAYPYWNNLFHALLF